MSFAEEPGIAEANEYRRHGGTYCIGSIMRVCMRRRGDLGVGSTDRYVSVWSYVCMYDADMEQKEKREKNGRERAD
jgi:hypothetical protein